MDPSAGMPFQDDARLLKLQDENRFLKSVIESAASPILVADREGVILLVNDAFLRLTGFTLEEVIGKTPRIQKSGRHDQAFYRQMWETLLSGQVWRGELVNRRKDGTLYTEEQCTTPIRDREGRISHFVAIKQDVTARKALEAQLRQSQRMEAIGQLAGGVAHDFNNLLLVINGYCELVLGKLPADHPQRGDVQQVHRAGLRARDLTRQLLAFSRQQVLDPKVIDLNDTVRRMEKMLERLLPDHIRIVSDLAPDLGRVFADPGQVEQVVMNLVVMNLVVNARDAMPRGGRIQIETRNVEVDAEYVRGHPGASVGRHVLLSVADTGEGIPAEILPRIFEPFFTTKPSGKGTGLGLSTVHGIVHQSGGTIDVVSEVGLGTRFLVYLPRADAPSEGVRETTIEASLLGRGRILLAEDEPDARQVVRCFLEAHGYEVVQAADGQEAWDIASSSPTPFDALVTDVVMPRLDGKELATRLASRQPGLRVILMTGYTDDEGLRQGDIPEGWFLLQKPFDARTLAERLRDQLRPRFPYA